MSDKTKGPGELELSHGPTIPRFLTAREVADLLRVSVGSVYNLELLNMKLFL